MLHTGGEWTKGYVYIFVHFFFFFFFVYCSVEFGEFDCCFVSFLRLVLWAGLALLEMGLGLIKGLPLHCLRAGCALWGWTLFA